jgi:hypothetical protein
LGERLVRNEEVSGSIPLSSTKSSSETLQRRPEIAESSCTSVFFCFEAFRWNRCDPSGFGGIFGEHSRPGRLYRSEPHRTLGPLGPPARKPRLAAQACSVSKGLRRYSPTHQSSDPQGCRLPGIGKRLLWSGVDGSAWCGAAPKPRRDRHGAGAAPQFDRRSGAAAAGEMIIDMAVTAYANAISVQAIS